MKKKMDFGIKNGLWNEVRELWKEGTDDGEGNR